MSQIKNSPTIIILFGATGDLTARKIVPALFHLFEKKQLPERIRVIGFSRPRLTQEDFKDSVDKALSQHGKLSPKITLKKPFLDIFSYVQGLFQEEAHYHRLASVLKTMDDEWGLCTNKLFYLAVPPQFYKTIFQNLDVSQLTKPCGYPNWTRVIVEKPFGKDLKTAQGIDNILGKIFKEEQIYRIDHYFGKEMVQNILAFRFSNNLFEKNWNKDSIESVEIKLLESIGVETRGNFYDGIGALRDVGQNHMLQMLALITMNHPGEFKAKNIRQKRFKILKNLKIFSSKEIKNNTFRAQYKGYRDIKGVKPESQTETYFKIKASLKSPRWKGVPLVLESGKRLAKEKKEIVVTFRHADACLCPKDTSVHYQNKITFYLQPHEGISIRFLSKKPGGGMEIEERNFEFNYHKLHAEDRHVEEYERLLLDCIKGDQTLFVSTEEVKAMWEFIDPIVRAWQKNGVPLEKYEQGAEPKTTF